MDILFYVLLASFAAIAMPSLLGGALSTLNGGPNDLMKKLIKPALIVSLVSFILYMMYFLWRENSCLTSSVLQFDTGVFLVFFSGATISLVLCFICWAKNRQGGQTTFKSLFWAMFPSLILILFSLRGILLPIIQHFGK